MVVETVEECFQCQTLLLVVLTLKVALNYLVYIYHSIHQWVCRLCPASLIPNRTQQFANYNCIHPQVTGREAPR
jgi:hypothetical protein